MESLTFFIGDIDILDFPAGSSEIPESSHCIVEIGHQPAVGYEIFFMNAVNAAWCDDERTAGTTGFCGDRLVVQRLEADEIKSALEAEISSKDPKSFEDFLEKFKGKLRWDGA